MTDEELLIIDCAVYDPELNAFRGDETKVSAKTLGEWADQWLALNAADIKDDPSGEFEGGMTYAQFAMVAQTVRNNTSLSGLTVADVTPRAVSPEGKPLGNQLTLTSPDGRDVIVAFQGTDGDAERYGNGLGGFPDTTYTPVRKGGGGAFRGGRPLGPASVRSGLGSGGGYGGGAAGRPPEPARCAGDWAPGGNRSMLVLTGTTV
ncbi:MAG: hypothetical protein LBK54_02890 [Propionibacteriaceae bacterium]|jgi:hypothetical protein|nr:hypothetical protein [Propionibacteriaceae bacterium]